MSVKTHERVSENLVGKPLEVITGVSSTVELQAIDEMAVDFSGLVHGGFTFGLADYAAMLAVNHPNVVLGYAQAKFTAPVRVGDKMIAKAVITKIDGGKSEVNVDVTVGTNRVFTGSFNCYSLEKHILDRGTK